MLRVRQSVSPLLRKRVLGSSPLTSRPILYHSRTNAHHHVVTSYASFNRQFSLFGLFQTSSTKRAPDQGNVGSTSSQSGEPVVPASEPVNTLPTPSEVVETDFSDLTSMEPDTDTVISLTEEILTPPITFLSQIFVLVHDALPFDSWAFTIISVTVAFRVAAAMGLEHLGLRRSKQLRSIFEPMRTVLTAYTKHPQLSAAPRANGPSIQRMAMTINDRISNHYSPQGANYAPTWARLSQIPLFLGISEALRAMIGCNPGLLGLIFGAWAPVDPKLHALTTLAALHRPDMAMDSIMFNSVNLTMPDPSGGLAVMFAAIICFNLYRGLVSIGKRRRLEGQPTMMTEVGVVVAIGAGACAFTVAKSIPAGLLLFWIANGLMSINLKLPKLLGVDNFSKDLLPRLGIKNKKKETGNDKKPVLPKDRSKREFVAPTRRLMLSKKQTLFLADDIVPKKKIGR